MTQTAATMFPCPHCGNLLIHGQLACGQCGGLVYMRQLQELAAAAQHEERFSPVRAAMLWQQCLPLLPANSPQSQMVSQRIGMLNAGLSVPPLSPPDQQNVPAYSPAVVPQSDPWRLAIAKTLGSMLISIIVYTWLFSENGLDFGLKFATGFVLLMLVHELGHSITTWYYGLSASPPIFIPFLGAVINLRQPPRNALEEAVIGIGGPVTGTLAALVVYLIYRQTGSLLMLRLAEFGFLLNLFNMLPVPPLDGGRVTAAVSPWIWIPGLLIAAGMVVLDYVYSHSINPIMILLLIMAWPRVRSVLIDRKRRTAYYQIGWKAKCLMGTAYVALGVLLAVMYILCQIDADRIFGPGMMG